ncbi:MAG: TGS domain-containing protein, partial [Bacteroidales bacterium]|nr:TGS domain-containing protein [Bacteroidales bacterium]
NGYESLHTTVMGPRNRWVEVQIRTRRMNENAEKGHAAHWMYKDVKGAGKKGKWLEVMRTILEKPDVGDLNEEQLKIRLADDSIFVFTPQGDLKKLPQGASVLDFAFEIHTALGEKCSGAKVNGVQVPIKHVLKNGDKVEISSSKNQKPNLDWLNFVITNRARNKIKRFLRVAEFNRSDEGREILRRKLNQLDLILNDAVLNKLLPYYKLSEPVELFHSIAVDKIDVSEIKEILQTPSRPIDEALKEKIQKKISAKTLAGRPGTDFLLIDNNPELGDYTLAKCCMPVSGDEIFGFVTVGTGIKIHRTDCPNALQMRSRYPYRVVSSKWVKKDDVTSFVTTIRISGQDRLGILNDITNAISQDLKVNMRGISVETAAGKFEGIIKVMVLDARNLDLLLHRLSKISGVKKATRVAGV